jgi:hypothetical protein
MIFIMNHKIKCLCVLRNTLVYEKLPGTTYYGVLLELLWLISTVAAGGSRSDIQYHFFFVDNQIFFVKRR